MLRLSPSRRQSTVQPRSHHTATTTLSLQFFPVESSGSSAPPSEARAVNLRRKFATRFSPEHRVLSTSGECDGLGMVPALDQPPREAARAAGSQRQDVERQLLAAASQNVDGAGTVLPRALHRLDCARVQYFCLQAAEPTERSRH